jgi:hypothetical protein
MVMVVRKEMREKEERLFIGNGQIEPMFQKWCIKVKAGVSMSRDPSVLVTF